MSILVTGAAGFIGSHFVEFLLSKQGDEPIVCVDNFNDYYDPALKRNNAALFDKEPRVTFLEKDFCDVSAMKTLFHEHAVRFVVHLGAYAGVRVSVSQPLLYARNNAEGTLVLLETSRMHPVEQFVLVSSSTVYGKGAEIPFREDRLLGIPASPYGASKRAAELFGMTYLELHDVPVVAVRPFSVYGPRLRPDLALSIFTNRILRGESLPLYGDGSIRRDMTHVSDICDGLYNAMTQKQAVGHRINLGNSHPIAMSEVIHHLETAAGMKANIEYYPRREEDLETTCADLTLARDLLNYEPRVLFQEGAKEFVHWYREWYKVPQ